MRAEIVSIGTEIMLGEITDTNAAYLAGQLPQFGIDLLYVTQVGDNPGRLREVLARAWERSDLTITTGGLGPTEDDLTRETVAEMLGEALTLDKGEAARLRGWFESRGRDLLERNLKQAMLIPSARFLPNPRGTAPGWWVERAHRAAPEAAPEGDPHVIVIMPGPPAEMHHMWEQQVAPELERRAQSILVTRTLKTSGLGESTVDERISPLLNTVNPSIGVYARRDGVHVRIGAKASTRAAAEALIAPLEAQLRERLGPAVWGHDADTLEAGVGRLLRERGLTLATMESATGGAIADAITAVDGASHYFRGALVAYQTELKVAFGVPAEAIAEHGVYSPQTARAMAAAARERLDADIGIGVTGIAGPQELEGQPPGTMHIALTDGLRTAYGRSGYNYQGRAVAKRRAILEALTLLRGWLLGEG